MLVNTNKKTSITIFASLLACAATTVAQSTPPVPKTIYNAGGTGDGAVPYSISVMGNTVYSGTKVGGSSGFGAVIKLNPPTSVGGAWTDTVIYSFPVCCEEDNWDPKVMAGEDGNVYVITGYGTIFALMPPASPGGAWTPTTTYQFASENNGDDPAALVEKGGVVYGVATGGNGTVFALVPPASPDGAWTEATLYAFMGGHDGAQPNSLVMGAHGVIYGTTFAGGVEGLGTVFSLAPPSSPGGAWTEKVIWTLDGGIDPADPMGIALGGDGVLYGASAQGGVVDSDCGVLGCGTVFALTPPAAPGGLWNESTLYSFTGGFDGRNPIAGVTIANDGSLWGLTSSSNPPTVVFSLTPPITSGDPWTFALHYAPNLADGYQPIPGLVKGRNGILYGADAAGGSFGGGTIYSVHP